MTTKRAGVAVIGAGVIGLAISVQLQRAGVRDVVVIDRESSPGMGSSSRANGGVRAQFAVAVNIEFSRYTIAALAALDTQSHGQVGLRRIGYLLLGGTSLTEDALRRGYDLQRELGVAVRWLTAAEAIELAPYVRADGLRAATFCADDGVIDPHGVITALSDESKGRGANHLYGEAVVGLDFGGSHAIVETATHSIEAEYVVNAAGPDARAVATLAGVDLPVQPYRRNLICTEPVAGYPDPIPMCVDLDTGVLTRREAGGFLVGYSDPRDRPSWDTTFDPGFTDAIAERVPNRFPFLSTAQVNPRKCWAGLYPETPDHLAIIDSAPGLENFIQCAGFGGHGIMHSLAAGQAVTELILQGRCLTFDISPLRLRRSLHGGGVAETAVL